MDTRRRPRAVPTTLWFVRHGEVATEHIGSFVGTLDVPLSDVGKHQAAAVASFFDGMPIDAVLASPRQRAQETAAPMAKSGDFQVETRQAFAEMDFGEWEGLHWPEIEARDPEFAAKWQTDPATIACPGGDTAGDFAARVQRELHHVLDEFRGRNVVLFGHAGVNRAIMADIMGIPYMQSFSLSQDYGCVNAAGWDGPLAQVALVNLVPGPRSVRQGDGKRVGE